MNDAAKVAALESTVATLQANMTSLSSSLGSAIDAAVADTAELKGSVDTFYLLYSGALVFFMQARGRTPSHHPPLPSRAPPPLWRTGPCPSTAPGAERRRATLMIHVRARLWPVHRRGLACSRPARSGSRTRATFYSRTCSTRAPPASAPRALRPFRPSRPPPSRTHPYHHTPWTRVQHEQ